MDPRVVFCFSSGTGNTDHAVRLLASRFSASGWQTSVFEAFRTAERPVVLTPLPQLLVVACPTLGFSAPAHFLRWLKKLPPGGGTPAALVAVCGGLVGRKGLIPGASGAVRRELAGVLKRRGDVVVSASEHSYPVNWTQVMAPQPEAALVEVESAADAGIVTLATLLLAPGAPPTPSPVVLGSPWWLLAGPVFRTIARRLLGKLYVADARCNRCGWCVESCPAQAIRLGPSYPSWNWNCDGCNRCINRCPKQAVQVSWVRLGLHLGSQVVLTVAGLVAGIGFWLVGTLVEVVVLERLLGTLEQRTHRGRWLTSGPTTGWGRYRTGWIRAEQFPEEER